MSQTLQHQQYNSVIVAPTTMQEKQLMRTVASTRSFGPTLYEAQRRQAFSSGVGDRMARTLNSIHAMERSPSIKGKQLNHSAS